jgi:ABC-2 type transport system permease protein
VTGPTGPVWGSPGLVRAEFRKMFSTKLWWALLVPVVALAALVNLFGGLFTAALSSVQGGAGTPSLLPASVAYGLSLTSVFAAVYAIVAAAGEFRHRTVTTTYLLAPRRGRVLLAKTLASATMGMVYAACAVVVGVVAGLAAQAGVPDLGTLMAVAGIGIAVAALWGALGTALGTAISNQATVLVVALVYMLVGELLVSALLNNSGSAALARFSAFLPVNAGDVALYDLPAADIAGREGPRVVELLAGVTAPPHWWGALLVLAAWTAAATATAWVVGGRRDVT